MSSSLSCSNDFVLFGEPNTSLVNCVGYELGADEWLDLAVYIFGLRILLCTPVTTNTCI